MARSKKKERRTLETESLYCTRQTGIAFIVVLDLDKLLVSVQQNYQGLLTPPLLNTHTQLEATSWRMSVLHQLPGGRITIFTSKLEIFSVPIPKPSLSAAIRERRRPVYARTIITVVLSVKPLKREAVRTYPVR